MHGGPGAEQGGAYPDQGGALGDGVRIVAAHAHGQAIHITLIIPHICLYVNKKLSHSGKKRAVGPRFRGDGWNCHQAPQAHVLHRRAQNVHKGDFGRLVVTGGARGTFGAAILAARAALTMGAGLVTVDALAEDIPAFDPLEPALMFAVEKPDYSKFDVTEGAGTWLVVD